MTKNLLQIGQVADRSQISIKTIRYYEEMGLIQTMERTDGGFRLFDADVINRLSFIKKLQKLGLSLQEIGQILQIYDQGQVPCGEIKHQLEQQVQAIDQKIQALVELKTEISQILATWEQPLAPTPTVICPILQKPWRK